jgi:hypothetical protein
MTKVITGFVFVCWDCPFPWKLFGQVFDRLFGNIQLRSPEIKIESGISRRYFIGSKLIKHLKSSLKYFEQINFILRTRVQFQEPTKQQ